MTPTIAERLRKRYPAITKEEVIEALRAARKLLNAKSRWTKGVYSRNKRGCYVAPSSDEAKCWCLYGAVLRTTNDNIGLEACVVTSLSAALPQPFHSLITYNDEHATHADILNLFDSTIEKLEKQDEE